MKTGIYGFRWAEMGENNTENLYKIEDYTISDTLGYPPPIPCEIEKPKSIIILTT